MFRRIGEHAAYKPLLINCKSSCDFILDKKKKYVNAYERLRDTPVSFCEVHASVRSVLSNFSVLQLDRRGKSRVQARRISFFFLTNIFKYYSRIRYAAPVYVYVDRNVSHRWRYGENESRLRENRGRKRKGRGKTGGGKNYADITHARRDGGASKRPGTFTQYFAEN